MSNSLQPHGLQHARLPCLSPTPRACSNSCPPSSHLILCHPLLLLPSVFPSIRVFSSESDLLIKWPKYWSFSFCISPSEKHSRLISLGLTGLISLLSKGHSRVFFKTTVEKRQFFGTHILMVQLSHPYVTTGKTIALTKRTFVGRVSVVQYFRDSFFW